MSPLDLGVLAAAAWSLLALLFQLWRVRGYGKRVLFAAPAGEPLRGVIHAFGPAMSPWAKESVTMNLPTYVAGMAYHAGILSAPGALGLALSRLEPPAPALWALRGLLAAGALGGLALLVKRAWKAHLRGISCPDDYLANLLTTGFVGLTLSATFLPGLHGWWKGLAIVLLLYVPLGKIRHCLFFFSTRWHLGAFFGRRGVYPPASNRT